MFNISRKNLLAYHLKKMWKRFPKEYNFFPQTYCMPSDKTLFEKDFKRTKNVFFINLKPLFIYSKKTYIVKPEASSEGKGIYLLKNINKAPLNGSMIIQKYITNPMLIQKLKFDLRIYVLVVSVDPLVIYIYNNGLTRLATEEYRVSTFFCKHTDTAQNN